MNEQQILFHVFLLFSQGKLQLNTNYSPMLAVLIIEVHVTTPHKTGWAQHRIQVVQGDPPALEIKWDFQGHYLSRILARFTEEGGTMKSNEQNYLSL